MDDKNKIERLELKVQALLEKVSSLTANYENQIADLRVDVTLYDRTIEALQEGPREDAVFEEEDS